MNTDTHVLLLMFWMITWMEYVNNVYITKVQPQGVA